MRTRQYEELLPYEFFAELDRCPIGWAPCAILEWHGKHQALGNDGLKVTEMCRAAADRAGGIVLPTLWMGPGGAFPPSLTRQEIADHDLSPGTMCLDRDLCWRMYTEMFEQMERVGFKVIMAVGGHYPAGDMLRAAAEDHNKHGGAKVWGGKDPDLIADQGGRGDHGGKFETSLLWALRPELVDFSHVDDDCGGRVADPGFGVSSTYTEASREFGEKWAAVAVDKLVTIATELLAKATAD